jgi:hypothetical protein
LLLSGERSAECRSLLGKEEDYGYKAIIGIY